MEAVIRIYSCWSDLRNLSETRSFLNMERVIFVNYQYFLSSVSMATVRPCRTKKSSTITHSYLLQILQNAAVIYLFICSVNLYYGANPGKGSGEELIWCGFHMYDKWRVYSIILSGWQQCFTGTFMKQNMCVILIKEYSVFHECFYHMISLHGILLR